MAEFFSDGHRDAYLDALEVEKAGYQARLPKAKYGKDPFSEAELQDHIKQVEAESARVRGLPGSVEETADDKPVEKLTKSELDGQYGHVEGYPADGNVAEKRAFVQALVLAHLEEDNDGE